MRRPFFRKLSKMLAFSALCGMIAAVPAHAAAMTEIPTTPELAGTEATLTPGIPNLYSVTGVLMNGETGEVLVDKDMNVRRFPASITKVLTALIAIENSQLTDQVTFTATGTRETTADSANIGMQLGEVLTMEQCLYAIMLSSANEVSSQVAEYVGGSVEAFVQMMNDKAAALGCKDTHFVNANGWHDDNHYTTAYDMALIFQEALKNKTFVKIAGATNYTIPATNVNPNPRQLTTHHAMMVPGDFQYEGTICGKTGNTNPAGNTLVTAVKRDGTLLLSVVMGAADGGQVMTDTINLMDYGFSQAAALETPTPTPTETPKVVKISEPEQEKTPVADEAEEPAQKSFSPVTIAIGVLSGFILIGLLLIVLQLVHNKKKQ